MTIENIYCFARQPENPEDFWKLNTELSYLNPFYEFKKKENSAIIMTAIWMIYDPKSSLVNSSVPEEKVKEEVTKNFLEQKIKGKFNWTEHKKIVDAYKVMCKTKLEVELDNMYTILQERQQAASDLDWLSDFDIKDKIISTQSRYYEEYFTLRSRLKEQRQEDLAHGKYTPSMMIESIGSYED